MAATVACSMPDYTAFHRGQLDRLLFSAVEK
jgi:hypothetical protein